MRTVRCSVRWGEGCLPRGGVYQHAQGRGVSAPVYAGIQPPLPSPWTEWQMLVETLPFRNYVADGKK